MLIYRLNKIPLLYTYLPFIRHLNSPHILCDCEEDLNYINDLKAISKGKLCISKVESWDKIILAAVIPDDINTKFGGSNEIIQWDVFFGSYGILNILSMIGYLQKQYF